MLKRILFAAILAGVCAGLLSAGLQAIRLVPLIHEAEIYEEAAAHDMAGHDQDMEWMPAFAASRTLYTVLANVLAATGFALLLASCYALTGDVDVKRGVIWGLAGFAVFHLAPAFGLPPEPPGAASAPLFDRQMWWLLTAAGTAGGLALVVFARGYVAKLAGVALIALPHVVGAPAPLGPPAVPAELAVSFAVGSLVTAALFWAVLGGLSGYFFKALPPGR
jgi:cobalt transporter subunit CbtA